MEQNTSVNSRHNFFIQQMETLVALLPSQMHQKIALLNKQIHKAYELVSSSIQFKLQQYFRLKQFFLTKFLHVSKAKAKMVPVELRNQLNFLKQLKMNARIVSQKHISTYANFFTIPSQFFQLFSKLYSRGRQKMVSFEEFVQNKSDYSETLELSSNPNVSLINEKSGDVITLNRSLLTVFQNIDEGQREINQEYKCLAESSEFSPQNVDFSDPISLLQRQKAILQKMDQEKKQFEKLQPFALIENLQKWGIILCFGGKFSVALFDRMKMTFHKSESKYVQRKKAGQRQINRDKQGKGVMNSVGSQMRRQNQKLLQQHIEDTMDDLIPHFKEVQCIFLFAPGLNRYSFLAENKPLKPFESKIISLNFPTKKANHTELQAAAEKLFEVRFDFSS